MTSLTKPFAHTGNTCSRGLDRVCCCRHPHFCPTPQHACPLLNASEPSHSHSRPLRVAAHVAANSTFACCERSDTFWREPVDDAAPYRRLVERLLRPLGERISRADVLRATWSTDDPIKSTCAILRVARGKVCKVRVLPQRLEKMSHRPQELGLLALVRKLLPLPDFELACAPPHASARPRRSGALMLEHLSSASVP